jgi:hypothetical protein
MNKTRIKTVLILSPIAVVLQLLLAWRTIFIQQEYIWGGFNIFSACFFGYVGYTVWKKSRKIKTANQRVDPTVKTPVESGNVQGTAGHP